MNPTLRLQLLKLADGRKLMRLEDESTGLSVERKISPEIPLVAQKAKLLRLFETMLTNDAAAA